MRIVRELPEFNASNMTWKFYLIGNELHSDNRIKDMIDNSKNHGENSLVMCVGNGFYKVYVKTWSEIFNDFDIRYKHIYENLNIEKEKIVSSDFNNANEVLESLGIK